MEKTIDEFIKDVQFEFRFNIQTIFVHWSRGMITDEEMHHRRYLNRKWFHVAYSPFKPYKEVPVADLPREIVQKYDNQGKFPLEGVLYYLDEEVPFYDDDYGQQVFAIWHGCEWSGGSYNFMYAELFCDELEAAIEREEWDRLVKEYGSRKED